MSTNSSKSSSVVCPTHPAFNEEEANVLFGGIFAETIMNVLNRTKGWLTSFPDPYTPLLISAITNKSKEKMNQKGYFITDHYFGQVNFAVWPRFTELCEAYIQGLNTPNLQQILQVEREIGVDRYYSHLCGFIQGLTACSREFQDNQMILYRISRILESVFKMFGNMSQFEQVPKDKKYSIIRRLNVIQRDTQGLNDQHKAALDLVVIHSYS